jgi:site-specific recombinase XerD
MHSKQVTILMPESIARFRSSCSARGQSANTAKAYSTDLRMLLSYHEMPMIPQEDFELAAQTWLNETRATAAPKTTARRLTSLRAFARWARWETDLLEYKAPTPGKTIPHPLPERLDGIMRLLQVASTPEQKALVGACGLIGLRVGEALAFRTSWMDTQEMMLRVRGKGDKERFVPVSKMAWRVISDAYVAAMMGDGYLIHYKDRSARKCITTLGQKARLKRPISSHDLRATYATVLSENGVNIRVIQELLGHSSVATTEIYTGVGMNALREAVELL